MLYEILYALAARDGRESRLFGNNSPLARKALAHSLSCDAFPELWFEIPLSGNPWFDLHALVSRASISPDTIFTNERTGGNATVFKWFATQRAGVKQLALSWDTGKGAIDKPAIQLLVNMPDTRITCDFLEACGRGDACPAYRAFIKRLPDGWFACYTGVFPGRQDQTFRVECIPTDALQQAYAKEPQLLEAHLRTTGLTEFGETLISRCQLMAQSPFKIEFQFDIKPDGSADETFGASVRFARPPGENDWGSFTVDGASGELMRQVETWGLADNRWRLLADTIFAKRVTKDDKSSVLYCYPAFLKLRWRAGLPFDAKAYLIAGMGD